MDDELLRRAKADPEAFRRETVVALKAGHQYLRAMSIQRGCGVMDLIRTLREPLPRLSYRSIRMLTAGTRAQAHNDALLQALDEMTLAERAALGW